MGKVATLAILLGGGLVVFWLYRYLSQRKSAVKVLLPANGSVGGGVAIDAYGADSLIDAIAKYGTPVTAPVALAPLAPPLTRGWAPKPVANTPPPPIDPICGAGGMHWDPIRGACTF